ncbi:hypothetical protein IWQ62_005428, partial [Dispira parvispora]
QHKRPKYGNPDPTATTVSGSLSLTARLISIKSEALDTAVCYAILTLPQHVQKNLPTDYHQPDLHTGPSRAELHSFASSSQSPNPPLLASTSGSQPDITGGNIPDNSNAVKVEEQQIGKRTRLIYRTMTFPPFTNIDDFNQTVYGMDLPGTRLMPGEEFVGRKQYRNLLAQTHARLSKGNRYVSVDKRIKV